MTRYEMAEQRLRTMARNTSHETSVTIRAGDLRDLLESLDAVRAGYKVACEAHHAQVQESERLRTELARLRAELKQGE